MCMSNENLGGGHFVHEILYLTALPSTTEGCCPPPFCIYVYEGFVISDNNKDDTLVTLS